MINATPIPVLQDNYAYLIEGDDGLAAIVDPSEADPIIAFLEKRGVKKIDYIFNTHHHWDHVNGNEGLKTKYTPEIWASAYDKERVPACDEAFNPDTGFTFGNETMQILETPGHTLGHVCLWFENSKALFCGDTLFSMGCGKLFEGTAENMFSSLQKLGRLPGDTKVYCGHEYTVANGEFCLAVEQDNQDIQGRVQEAKDLRSQDKPTIPSTIEAENKTNVFLRAKTAEEFADVRTRKDNF